MLETSQRIAFAFADWCPKGAYPRKLQCCMEGPILNSEKEDKDFFEKWSNLPIAYTPNSSLEEEPVKSPSSTPQLFVALSVIVVLIAILIVVLLRIS